MTELLRRERVRLGSALALMTVLAGLVLFATRTSNDDAFESIPAASPTVIGTPEPVVPDAAWFTPEIEAALCADECDAPLTRAMASQVFALVGGEASVAAAPAQGLSACLGASASDEPCHGAMTPGDMLEMTWSWLGSPGAHGVRSVGDTLDAADLPAQALRTFGVDIERLRCGSGELDCDATADDLVTVLQQLFENHFLVGTMPGVAAPADFQGIGPYWSRTRWDLSGQCLDADGEPRYGRYFARQLCIDADLDPALAHDVALHELAHVWQDVEGIASAVDRESDADCWASTHGATALFYVESGCVDDDHRQRILDRIAASVE